MDLQAAKPAQSILPRLLNYSALVAVISALACFLLYWQADGRVQRKAISAAAADWKAQAMDQLLRSVEFEYVFERNGTEAYVPLSWTDSEEEGYVERLWNDTEEPVESYSVSYQSARANLTAVFPEFSENPLLRFYMNAQKACLSINWTTSPNSSSLLKGLEPCNSGPNSWQTGLQVQYWRHMRIPLTCESGKDCTGKCMLEGGNWVGLDRRGSCYRYMMMDRICVKTVPVRISADEEIWAYDGGCFSGGQIVRYTRMSALRRYNFTSFPLEIRLSRDPVVVAFNVSTDYVDLAPSAYHYVYWAVLSLALGLTLSCFSLCLHRSYQQKEASYREQVDVMASLPE